MKKYIETDRLILRELDASDAQGMFELDSNNEVHKFIGNKPIKTIEEANNIIILIQKQYLERGIGRWAVIEKFSGEFIGWSGLKLITEYENNHINFYDVGYRIMPKYWGKGYATESATVAIEYGFTKLNVNDIFGSVNIENVVSRRVLEKCGLQYIEKFMWKDILCSWLKITKEIWDKQGKSFQTS